MAADIWKFADQILGPEIGRLRATRNTSDDSRDTRPLLGSPGVNPYHVQVGFYPSIEGAARIQSVGFLFPRICCVCGKPASRELPLKSLTIWERLRSALFRPDPILIPHCEIHGETNASFLLMVLHARARIPLIGAIGLNQDFLDQLVSLHTAGDHFPPWVAYPGSPVEVAWNQGEKEVWLMKTWRPFWVGLSHESRVAYLTRWKSGDYWADYLLNDPKWHDPWPSDDFT